MKKALECLTYQNPRPQKLTPTQKCQKHFVFLFFLPKILISGERVNLSSFSPACLPDGDDAFERKYGHIYGEIFWRGNV